MVIDIPTLPVLFVREIFQPLYMFIIASIIIWPIEQYFIYCGVIFLTAAIGISVNLWETYQTNKKIN